LGAPARRALLLAALLAALGAACLLVFWRVSGPEGLLGAGVGLLLGGGVAFVGQRLRARARRASGHKVVAAMMTATFTSFALFIALAFLLAFLWKEGAAAVLLSALAVYLAALFFEVVSAA
jgi:hypothetical protein